MPFRFEPLEIPDVLLVEALSHADARGAFQETWRRSVFAAHGVSADFAQDSRSLSLRGVLRGLHFQRAPAAQGKLVSVLRGRIFDVAVDLRAGSPTRARFVARTLHGGDNRMLWIPPGFAHGFCVLSDEADVVYKSTAEYSPAHEGGIRWNDPALAIPWPVREPILSPRDAALPFLADADPGPDY